MLVFHAIQYSRIPSILSTPQLFVFFTLISFFQFSSTANELISFNIPNQDANTALISFAEQSDTTIIFSFDLTSTYKTNTLTGFYPTNFALKKLLNQSGLVAEFFPNGQIKIKKEIQSISPLLKTNQSFQKDKKTVKHANLYEYETEQISVVGSRSNRRTINTLPVPVDMLSNRSLNTTGHHEVGEVLQTLAPSFNVPTSAISDGSDVLQPASLRGLGPDQTLVLINGKRRHQASLIHINNSIGRGTAGVDMNAIPIESIAYIEVLRDGAAAQYGSDAIAGVINIVLKGKHDKGNISLSSGLYSRGDGETIQLGVSKGLIIDENTFINTTLSMKEHNSTDRSGKHGSCQFNDCIELDDGSYLAGDIRELNTPRNTFNVGDAFYNQVAFTINGEHITNIGKIYSFFTYSNRENKSSAFFRHNADTNANVELQDNDATIPDGFLPKINSKITDTSFNLGKEIKLSKDSLLDLSYTFGKNSINYHVEDSINSSFVNAWLNQTDKSANLIRETLPKDAFAYGLKLSLQTVNLNYTQHFNDTSISLGLEHRVDRYSVKPGEQYSYADYDTFQAKSIFSRDLSAGIQGFPGIPPELAVNEHRTIKSLYLEIDSNITRTFNLTSALRYDSSTSFGHSTNAKLAGHWEINEKLALRGNISTGFRAPSMQQLYFNNISTQFIVNSDKELVPEIVKTYRNDSAVAKSLGINTLVPEESQNISLGAVYDVNNAINISLDYYNINIKKRIVMSNKIDRSRLDLLSDDIYSDVTKGQFFLNGAETTTTGVDLVATWKSTQLYADELTITLAGNITETNVNRLYPLYEKHQDYISIEELYSREDISIIEEWQPKNRLNLSSLYIKNNWTLNLSLNHYGKYTITDGERQTYTSKLVTNIKINYSLTHEFNVFLGSNNLFDITPDKNNIGNSRSGKIVDDKGNVIVQSNGVFKYSRRAAPFGYNGAYFYAGLSYQF